MAAAQGLASYLNPPVPVSVQEKVPVRETLKPPVPTVRPPTASPQFKVLGTICGGPSERSLALIREPGTQNAGRWVNEGTQVGHFVIHEIRPGSILYLDGERLCEMAIDRENVPTTVVASNGRPAAPDSQTSVSNARPDRTDSRPKRPSGNSRFTIGSARTTTLD